MDNGNSFKIRDKGGQLTDNCSHGIDTERNATGGNCKACKAAYDAEWYAQQQLPLAA